MSSSTKFSPCGLRQLLKKGGVAIADQAVFATGNFLLSVLLARRLPVTDDGGFSLAGFLLLAVLNQAFIIEPMMVFGAGKFRDSSLLASAFPIELRQPKTASAAAARGIILKQRCGRAI